ncbi:ABC transporter substrate-binding protein [Bradyrhizobium erythrophlei]|jgi:putative ABC transport system substrate-binding protein|uniref:Putative ABC transport system substrate-binding protein n=1 Tax=Bradyrhizobium erythrophlei TaxID=1437360 RepID=A0A1M5LMZ0_9BRAD|nr:ABC transporter substrate-binding protein [Bradyrhizobium erythrophlei]SHG66019.1 putative ABC transport system substrate-binding protein [Bradyrhizobium erythrophlei]
MNRRELFKALGMASFAWSSCANAQAPGRIPKVGMLWHAGSAEEEGAYFASLIQGFKDLGYVDGQTILFEHRYAHEQYERFPSLARELVGLKVDALMASILPAARAAQQATSTIPVVFVIVADPVGSGLAESLARPGSNLTGMSNVSEDLTAKRVQTFKDTVPSLKRMGLIVHPGGQSPPRVFEEYRAAATVFGVETVVLEARTPAELDVAMESASTRRLDAIASAPDSMIFNSRGRLADLALKSRLPYMGSNLDEATAGALLAYGPNHADIFRRSAAVVDKILHGEKASEIPIQQPVTFSLRLNLQTAKKIGLVIPPLLLARADEVIE